MAYPSRSKTGAVLAAALAGAVMLLTACGDDKKEAAPAPVAVPTQAAKAPEAAGPKSPLLARGPQSTEARVAQGVERSFNLRVLALVPAASKPDVDCRFGQCLDGNVLLASAMLGEASQQRMAAGVLRGWLVDANLVESACTPTWTHAIAFSADNAEYVVMLDYTCRKYRVLIDGAVAADGAVDKPAGKDTLDNVLQPVLPAS